MDKSVCLKCKSEFLELDNELKDDYGICLKCFANTYTTEDKRLKILSKIHFSNLEPRAQYGTEAPVAWSVIARA